MTHIGENPDTEMKKPNTEKSWILPPANYKPGSAGKASS